MAIIRNDNIKVVAPKPISEVMLHGTGTDNVDKDHVAVNRRYEWLETRDVDTGKLYRWKGATLNDPINGTWEEVTSSTSPGGGSSTFKDLTDTPTTLGTKGQIPKMDDTAKKLIWEDDLTSATKR